MELLSNIMRFLEAAEESTTPGWVSIVGTILPLGLMFVALYFIVLRPQKKQQKEMTDMREGIQKGDVVTTIGGIVGIVVNMTEDMLLLESGGDKTLVQVQKWAVKSIDQRKDGE